MAQLPYWEETVFGGFDPRYIARQTIQSGTKITSRLSVNPPEALVAGSFILIAFGLKTLENPLKNFRKFCPNFICG